MKIDDLVPSLRIRGIIGSVLSKEPLTPEAKGRIHRAIKQFIARKGAGWYQSYITIEGTVLEPEIIPHNLLSAIALKFPEELPKCKHLPVHGSTVLSNGYKITLTEDNEVLVEHTGDAKCN